jgi:uncharacterized MAPEG superfamily protein
MTSLPLELTLLGWSVVLLLAHVALQGQTMTRERGLSWGAGPRDGDTKPLGPLAGRAERALRNFGETYPAFVALALALAVSGRTGGTGTIGAACWFAARVLYIPLYLAGVPYLRSLCWLVSIAGLLLMLARLL